MNRSIRIAWRCTVIVALVMANTLVSSCASTEMGPDGKPRPVYRVIQERPDRLIVELPNRMIVVAQEIHASPVVSAQVMVKTGALYEQEFIGAGLSHFLEHLVASGNTTTRTEEESNALIGAMGADTNAFTSLEDVQYYIDTLSEHASAAVGLLCDWMRNTDISEELYSRERDVIQREFEMGDGEPGRILWKLTQQTRYRYHPARHPPIGYLDDFKAISRQQIIDFYKRMYVPNNMVFVVTGDINKRKIIDQIATFWAQTPARELPKLSFPDEPEIDSPRSGKETADIRAPRLRLAWPGTQLAQEHDYALDLLAVILGQGESSRLVQRVRDEQRRVTDIEAYNLSYHWGKGFFGIDAEPVIDARPGQPVNIDATVQSAKQAILAVVQQVVREGVTETELARAKRQTIAQIVYSAQTTHGKGNRLGNDLIGTGDPDYLEKYSKAIENITAAQIKTAAEKFLADSRLMTLTLLPRPENEPFKPLARAPEDPQAAQAQRVPIELDNRNLLARVRTALAVAQQAQRPVVVDPVRRYTLPNNLRLLVERNTSVPAVAIQMYSLGGLLADTPGKEGLARATAAMLIKGTATRSADQIAQETEDLGAALSTTAGNNTSYASGLSLKQDWRKLLELIADVTLRPTFPADEWALMQRQQLAGIDRVQDDWSSELRSQFLERYFPGHPWAVTPLGRRQAVSSFTIADLKKFHADHLSASDSVLAVFGDVDPDEVAQAVRQLFGSLPSRAATPVVPPKPVMPTAGVFQVRTAKPLAAVQIGLGPGVTRKSPDYPGLEVLARVLGNFPTGALDQELRGRSQGLVYSVGAGQAAGVVPGYISVIFNCTPARVAEALAKASKVLADARSVDVTVENLAHAKAAVLTGEFLSKQTNSDRATEAALDDLYDLGPGAAQRFLAEVKAVDSLTIKTLAIRYLGNPVILVLTHDPVPQEQLETAAKPVLKPAP